MSLTSLTDDPRPLLGTATAIAGEVESRAGAARLEASDEPNYRTRAMAWVLAATVVRFACLAPLPLGNGEAYYYSWSRFLDFSYYDHPPLVAWMVRATTGFGTSPAAVRLGPVVASAIFGLLFYRLAERLFRPRAAFFALVLVTALPVFVGSSFILNPEAPLAPLWVGFLLAVSEMRRRDEWHRPVLAGVLLGFAFLAKYTAVLLVPTALVYLSLSAPMRRWLRRPSLYAGGVAALLIALPVLVWNDARGWPSLRLHLMERASVGVPVAGENTINHLVEISSSNGTSLVESVLRVGVGQLMSYSPLLAPLLVWGLVQALRRAGRDNRDDRDIFLAAFSWPILLLLLAAMTRFKDAEQHWTMMSLVPGAIAAGGYADERWSQAKVVRALAACGVALSGILFLLANLHVRTTAILGLIPADHYDPRADITNELIGWDQVRASLARAMRDTSPALPGPGRQGGQGQRTRAGSVVLASNHYSLCGRLLFEMNDEPPVYCPTARRSAFDFIGRRDPPAEATVLALTSDIHDDLPAGLGQRSCTLVDEVDVEREGRRVARYYVHSCPPVVAESDVRASR